MSDIQVIEQDILSCKQQFNAVLCDKSISFDREANFAIQVLEANTYSLGIAKKNRQSVINAVTNVAAIGLSLNPAKKLAYLVPRKTGIVLEISYMGLVELAVASGSVRWVKAEIVREHDEFTLVGLDKPPAHNFNPFSKDRGMEIGVYVVVKTIDGDYLTEVMPIDDVYNIRDRSEAWKNGRKGPWATDPGEMIKKTCVKRASKMWPKTDRLDQAVHLLNTDGEEGIAVEVKKDRHAPAAGQGYEDFEAHWLAVLTEATTQGKQAYLLATKDVPHGANRDAFATKHHKALLAKAREAEQGVAA